MGDKSVFTVNEQGETKLDNGRIRLLRTKVVTKRELKSYRRQKERVPFAEPINAGNYDKEGILPFVRSNIRRHNHSFDSTLWAFTP